jgi:CheY-like chemotaxis protein
MTAKTISRAFDPFFTTKRSGAGFGLGLSTVRDVIHVMGGSITVESELGQGSTFTILLPAARPVSKQHQPLTDSRHTPARVSERRLTVLLIDDEQTVRRGTRRVLQSVGLQVLEASNGADGIRLYGERDPRPDAVLLDLEMPGLTGEDTLEALRELDPGVRVVMVSGHRDNARVRQLKASGAVAFVYKPWTLNELLDALDAAVEVPEPAQSTTVDEG